MARLCCDIAYSRSPAASRASARVAYSRQPGDLSVTDREHDPGCLLRFDAAQLARPPNRSTATTVSSPASISSTGLEPELVERVDPVPDVLPHGLLAARSGRGRRCRPLRPGGRDRRSNTPSTDQTRLGHRPRNSAARSPRPPATSPTPPAPRLRGLRPLGVLIHTPDLAPRATCRPRRSAYRPRPRLPGLAPCVRDHDDLIPGVDDFLDRHLEFVEGARPPLHVRSHRIKAGRRRLVGRIQHDLGDQRSPPLRRGRRPRRTRRQSPLRTISTFCCDIARPVSAARTGTSRTAGITRRERPGAICGASGPQRGVGPGTVRRENPQRPYHLHGLEGCRSG